MVIAVLATPAIAGACRKSVRWFEAPPYFVPSDDGALRGINAELLTAVLQRVGCAPDFVHMPFPRAIVELEHGRLDVLASVAHTPQRERFAYFSSPVERRANLLCVLRANMQRFALGHLGDILGTDFRLGYQPNIHYGVEYEALERDPQFIARLVPVPNDISALHMIAAGRLDGMIMDSELALEAIRQEGLQQTVVPAEIRMEATPTFIALSRQAVDADFAARFNAALDDLIASGELARIFRRYNRCATVGPAQACD